MNADLLKSLIICTLFLGLSSCTTREKPPVPPDTDEKKETAENPRVPPSTRAKTAPEPSVAAEGRILKVTGQAGVRPSDSAKGLPASAGRDLFIGTEVRTADDGMTRVLIVELGIASLKKNSSFSIGEFGRCAAVLHHGWLELEGPSSIRSMRTPCVLVTPTVAVWAPASQALIATAGNGASRIGCIRGKTHVSGRESVIILKAGQEVETGADGSTGKIRDMPEKIEEARRLWGKWVNRSDSLWNDREVDERASVLVSRIRNDIRKFTSGLETILDLKQRNMENMDSLRQLRTASKEKGVEEDPSGRSRIRQELADDSKMMLTERQRAVETWYRAYLTLSVLEEFSQQSPADRMKKFSSEAVALRRTLAAARETVPEVIKRNPRRRTRPAKGSRTAENPIRRKVPGKDGRLH